MASPTTDRLTDEFDLIQKCECGHPKAAHAMAYGSSYAHPRWAPAPCSLTIGRGGIFDGELIGQEVCGCEVFSLDPDATLPEPEPAFMGGTSPMRHPHFERYGQPETGSDGRQFRSACRCGWQSEPFDVEAFAITAGDGHENAMNRQERDAVEPRDRHFIPDDLELVCGCGHPKADHYMKYGSLHAAPAWADMACWDKRERHEVVEDNCGCEEFHAIGTWP
jgi:hypothetical protein